MHRVALDLKRFGSRLRGVSRFVWRLVWLVRKVDLVHLQGFSRKNILVTIMAKLLAKRIVLTLHTGLHDDAGVVKARSRLGFWTFMKAGSLGRGHFWSWLSRWRAGAPSG